MDQTTHQNENKARRAILLVNPPVDSPRYTREDRLRTYLSLGSLASVLRSEQFLRKFAEKIGLPNPDFSFDTRVISLSSRPEDKTVEEYLADFIRDEKLDPVMICATATSGDLDQVARVADAASSLAPDALRVIGGPHVSVAPEEFLRDSRFQVACLGEGAETLAELAIRVSLFPGTDLSEIPGLAYKDKNGQVRVNPRRRYVFGLDDYPFPSDSLDLFVDDLEDRAKNRRDLVYALAGMGCPFDCSFCAQKAINQGRIRERSADSLFVEIAGLHERGFRKFALVQESFFSNRKRFKRFRELIGQSGLDVEWTAEARADQVDFPILQEARQQGLRFIQIGLESGDPDQLKSIDKKIRLEDARRLIGWLKELNIDTALYLLVGLPGQTWQSVLRTALFIKNNPPYNRVTKHLSVAIAVPYPGARLALDSSIRLLPDARRTLSWPARNPDVALDEDGALTGAHFTETDAMTPEEILEAFFLLDNFGYFLLHALHDDSLSRDDRAYSYDLSLSLFHAMERRALRDLIVRAHDDPTAVTRKRFFLDLAQNDGAAERLIKDIGEGSFPSIFTEFLTVANFRNGFPVLKKLSIDDRILFMKLCALVWTTFNRARPTFVFSYDALLDAGAIAETLRNIDPRELEQALDQAQQDVSAPGFLRALPHAADTLSIGKISFHPDRENDAITLSVD